MTAEATHCIRTLRLKVKSEAHPWLNAAATEVNQVWNYANATSDKAAWPFSGSPKWLSAFDLDKLTAGAARYFERIRSETVQRVNAEFVTRRSQCKKSKLRWRKSWGATSCLRGGVPRPSAGTGLRCQAVRRTINPMRGSGPARNRRHEHRES